jgi:hypothetical protein
VYVGPDEARSDVILTGAATVFGGTLLSLLLSAPGVPSDGVAGGVVVLLGWFALSALTPLLLARYREDLPAGVGLPAGRHVDIGAALLLAAPVAVLGVLRGLLVDGSVAAALLGRPGRPLLGSPAVGPGDPDVVGAVLETVGVVVLTVGAVVLVGFLVVRGRDAFREDDRSAHELLRTIGLGAAAAALVLGGVRALVGDASLTTLLLNVAALVVLVLVADRLVPAATVVSRPAVLTPVVLLLVAHVLAAGGLFRGDLLLGLSSGALAAGTAAVVAVLTLQRGTVAVAVPMLIAIHWWPTCLSPLPFAAC